MLISEAPAGSFFLIVFCVRVPSHKGFIFYHSSLPALTSLGENAESTFFINS